MIDWQTAYPNRYYFSYDTSAAQPTIILGRYDMAIYDDPSGFPPASEMLAVTEKQFRETPAVGFGIQAGQLVTYTPPQTTPALKDLATTMLSSQKAYVSNEFLVYGEAVPDAWSTYLKALRAISDGTDTTSTSLPVSPLDAAPVVLTPAQKTAAALEALGEYLMEQQAKGFFFTPTGTEVAILFSTSSHAQSQYVGANSLARDNPTTSQNFITNSGVPIVLTADDVIKLTNGVASYINDTNATYASLVAKVSADYTTDITVGWPDNKLP